MSTYLTLFSDGAALLIAGLYILAGQAHFTDYLTPGLSQNVELMTYNSHAAFSFLELDYLHLKRLFGAFDLLAAALLIRQRTRRTGLIMAAVGFSAGLYGQLHSGEGISQVAAMLGVAVLGLLLAPKGQRR